MQWLILHLLQIDNALIELATTALEAKMLKKKEKVLTNIHKRKD